MMKSNVSVLACGTRFGRWTVLKHEPSVQKKGRHAMYRCRCDCGIERTLYALALRSGMSVSCGCVRRTDFTGQKFDRWTVISTVPGWHRFTCKCACGAKREMSYTALKRGSLPNCHCIGRRGIKWAVEAAVAALERKMSAQARKPDLRGEVMAMGYKAAIADLKAFASGKLAA